jgi:uncharacterized membrane protein
MDPYLLIAVLHVAFIAPFLLWVGFNRAATPEWVYSFMVGLGLFVLIYHAYKAVGRWFAKSPVLWINLIHVLFVAPLILWIGYYGKKTERPAYDMLLIVAFGAFGYHLYKMVLISQTFVKGSET